jgi:ferredoxin
VTRVRFLTPLGGSVVEVTAPAGTRLLDLAQSLNLPLEGACEGSMACSTCHVILNPDDYAKLKAPSDEEEDMLDFAFGVTRTSRLACQVWLDGTLEALEVRVPTKSYNMQSR